MRSEGKKIGGCLRIRKLSTGMIMVILTCLIIPYFVLSGILITSYTRRNNRQIEQNVTAAYENGGALVAENLSAVIEKSRQATYDGVIRRAWEAYRRDGDESAMYREITSYLSASYKFSKIISNAILLFRDPVTMEYYTYSNAAGATYADIGEFRENTRQAVLLAAEDLDTKLRFIGISGHLYAVRNLVAEHYEPFATLVLEVNADRVFESMKSILWQTGGEVRLDGACVGTYREKGKRAGSAESAGAAEDAVPETTAEAAEDTVSETAAEAAENAVPAEDPKLSEGAMQVTLSRDRTGAVMVMKYNYQYFYFFGDLDRSQMLSDSRSYISIFLLVCVMLIPLLCATLLYLYRNITRPVRMLMTGTDKIRDGEYSWRVEPFSGNDEMGHLVDNFNHMAGRLEDSFNRIYVEEIAERDATLKALQSQINPHFLNNTLEIINWKARMNGNEEVSEMISALSTMMNATLNRSNEMFITLREELSYVDAYLYIIRQRFGEKFVFEEQTDPALLDILIPRLIIQPIIENAVEHGVPRTGIRRGSLRIYRETEQPACGEEAGRQTGELPEDTGFVKPGDAGRPQAADAGRPQAADAGRPQAADTGYAAPDDAWTLVIRVENNGQLTEQDRERIRTLLDDAPDGGSLDRTCVGIRNVHRRLRILYGKQSGLQIYDTPEGMTVSELRILRTNGDKSAQPQTILYPNGGNQKQAQDKHVHSSNPSETL